MTSTSLNSSDVFVKDTLINGQPARIECVDIAGQTFSVNRGLLTVVQLEDDWFQEVGDPAAVVDALKRRNDFSSDIFTFCQRLPHVEPKYPYGHEWESIAAIPIETYDRWWNQIESATRNKIRKSRKLGVEVRECSFDDEFVRGMASIFNETPIRQGRRFWHYGKDFETVKKQFSRFLYREELLGAYYRDELVGFVMLGKTPAFADLGQIISKVEHRDKAVTNALIAKAVEVCCARGIGHLVYAFWTDDSLGEFKRQSGFREVKLPRYYVPLTLTGRMALRTGAHRGLKELLPAALTSSLKRARRAWYQRQERGPSAGVTRVSRSSQ
ncbi:MAG TPA: hypothetical protein VL282_17815 [Tepidisphaeraceae bacterium]|nr:hypothetical protein [Tepidisphaeraceae bacterium]